MKLRVGLVGLGEAWEIRHRPALRALADKYEVRAVCDQVAHRAEAAARDFGATAVDGYQSLSTREDIDVVMMLGEQWYGSLPIMAACDAGKAVYCAAAFHLDPDEALRVRTRVEQSGIAFMAEFPRRVAPATLRLKELLVTRLGKPRLLFCHRRVAFSEQAKARRKPRSRGSDVRDLIELVDWCRYVVGDEPNSVLGLAHAAADGDGEDYKMMSLDFSREQVGQGVVAQISCGYYMPGCWEEAVSFRPPAALQVACENGIAFIDLPSSLIWFDKAGRHQESLDSERPVGELLLSHFHRQVTSLIHNPAGLEDAYRALTIVLAARQSQETGQRISLPK